MYTKEDLLNASPAGVIRRRNGNPYYGVLTTEQAQQHHERYPNRSVVIVADVYTDVFFLSDDHCFGVGVLPKGFVPTSHQIPKEVVPRPGLEDGVISTVKQLVQIFEHDRTQIETLDELVVFLNNRPEIPKD